MRFPVPFRVFVYDGGEDASTTAMPMKVITARLSALLPLLLFGCGDGAYEKRDGQWHHDGQPLGELRQPDRFRPINDAFARDEQAGDYRGPSHS